eukprot:907095-Pyramimonas_sp.AAC.1
MALVELQVARLDCFRVFYSPDMHIYELVTKTTFGQTSEHRPPVANIQEGGGVISVGVQKWLP